jgi:hypothetical protein
MSVSWTAAESHVATTAAPAAVAADIGSPISCATAIEPVYWDLEPRGLVHAFPVDICPWVRADFDEQAMIIRYGQAYVNTEYKCIMDASGTRIFGRLATGPVPVINNQCLCLIGIDWNDDWGHAALAGIQVPSGEIYLVGEYRGLALRAPREPGDRPITDPSALSLIDWLLGWQQRFPGQCAIVAEQQGVNYINALVEGGVRGITPEGWSKAIQEARIPLVIDLCDQGKILFTKNVPWTLKQAKSYRRDDKGNIPHQEDHHIDCLHHLVMARSIPNAWAITDPVKSWI